MAVLTFKIKGMKCAGCVSAIEAALRGNTGIEGAEVKFATKGAIVSFDEKAIDAQRILETLDRIGYPAELVSRLL